MNILQSLFTPNNTISTISFEEIKEAVNSNNIWIINTLPRNEQDVLIHNTVSSEEEETLINSDIENYDIGNRYIIIYGKNSHDCTVETKYKQLLELGAKRTVVYRGGLFEWLLLQDIYGYNAFPTTQKVLDILKYK